MATVWLGPVSSVDVPGAKVPGEPRGFVQCAGRACAEQGAAWAANEGVSSMLAAAKLDPTAKTVDIGAFSAGGSAAKRVLALPAARARVRSVMLADATYTDWASPGKPLPPEGFVLFGLDALGGEKLFVATASSAPNGSLPNGSQTLEALKDEIERRSGVAFQEGVTIPGLPKQPVRMWRSGGVLLADYGDTVGHSQHARLLASPMWQHVLLPWLASSPGDSGGVGGCIVAGLVGLGIGFSLVREWLA